MKTRTFHLNFGLLADTFLSSGKDTTSLLDDFENTGPLRYCQIDKNDVKIRLFIIGSLLLDVTEDNFLLARLQKDITVVCLPCGPGWTRQTHPDNPNLWTCIPCGKKQYVIDPNQHGCKQCPAGAKCEDEKGAITFVPIHPAESVWENTSSGLYRLIRCPPGYVLVRDETMPVMDRCVPCPPYFYSVDEAIFGKKMWALTGEDTASSCNP